MLCIRDVWRKLTWLVYRIYDATHWGFCANRNLKLVSCPISKLYTHKTSALLYSKMQSQNKTRRKRHATKETSAALNILSFSKNVLRNTTVVIQSSQVTHLTSRRVLSFATAKYTTCYTIHSQKTLLRTYL